MGCLVEETLGDIRISSDCYHGLQIVKDDIEAIEETEAFYATYQHLLITCMSG